MGAFVLDAMWERLGIKRTLRRLLSRQGFDTPIERLLFALVAQRALDPGSTLAAERWVGERAFIPGLPQVEVQHLYRAMDFLLEAHDETQREVFWNVWNLFDLEVDVLFIDEASTSFEIEVDDPDLDEGELATEARALERDASRAPEDDAARERERRGLRKRSRHSKDSRPDLSQVVIGFAVTRDGIPVKCWVWPGNTVDATVINEVKRDLNEWKLGRLVLVMDTGFNSEANRKTLQGAGDATDPWSAIIGEKMRLGKDGTPPAALKRAGRYKTLENGLRIKREAHLDGTYLISTNDDHLTAEDVALGCRQLHQIERVNRDLKHTVDVRPVYHHTHERTKAHVLLCWLALLLIRVIENQTNDTWGSLKQDLWALVAGQHRSRHGPITQTSTPTSRVKSVLDAPNL